MHWSYKIHIYVSFVLSLFFQNSVEFCSSLPCAFHKYCLPEPVRGQGSFCRSLQAICFEHVLENYHISSRLIQLCLPIAKDNLFRKRQNVAALYKNCRLENKISFFFFFSAQWKTFYYTLHNEELAGSSVDFSIDCVVPYTHCATEFLLMQYWALEGIFCYYEHPMIKTALCNYPLPNSLRHYITGCMGGQHLIWTWVAESDTYRAGITETTCADFAFCSQTENCHNVTTATHLPFQ